jgi:hypothetical protein
MARWCPLQRPQPPAMNPTMGKPTLGAMMQGPGFYAWTERHQRGFSPSKQPWRGVIRYSDGREMATQHHYTKHRDCLTALLVLVESRTVTQ